MTRVFAAKMIALTGLVAIVVATHELAGPIWALLAAGVFAVLIGLFGIDVDRDNDGRGT